MTKLTNVKVPLNNPVAHWFYENLKLPPHLLNAWKVCYESFINNEPYTAVHLRIEDDWKQTFCTKEEKKCFSPAEIASAVSTHKNGPQKVVFIHGTPTAKYNTGTGESPLEVWAKFNPRHQVLHKSQSPQCQTELSEEKLSYNDNAMLDMWVAIQSTMFVGHMASSFSNAVTLSRRMRDATSADYTYVCPAIKELVFRKDNGSVMGVGEAACSVATRESRRKAPIRLN